MHRYYQSQPFYPLQIKIYRLEISETPYLCWWINIATTVYIYIYTDPLSYDELSNNLPSGDRLFKRQDDIFIAKF